MASKEPGYDVELIHFSDNIEGVKKVPIGLSEHIKSGAKFLVEI